MLFLNPNVFIYLPSETAFNRLMHQDGDGKLVPDPGTFPGFMFSWFRSSFCRENHVSWEDLPHCVITFY